MTFRDFRDKIILLFLQSDLNIIQSIGTYCSKTYQIVRYTEMIFQILSFFLPC